MRDYLTELEEQLVELTERGAHRRRRVRADALAVVATLAVVVAVAAIIATVGSGTHRGVPASQRQAAPKVHHRPHVARTITATPASPHVTSGLTPAGGPVPAGFNPESFTAIDEATWWLLGPAPCSSPPCTSIVRTTNAGRSFVGIPAPRTDGVTQLRFADIRDGFAYGPELWATHDGGAHWHRVAIGGSVSDLEASGGWVYALVARGKTARLERADASLDRWSVLPAAGNATGDIWAQGSDVLVEAANSSRQQLMVSHDLGQTFTAYPVPPSVGCQFQEPAGLQEPAGPVVWEHCATGTMSGVWRSPDGGRTFVATAGPHSWPGPELPNSAAFAAASASTAVVGYRQLYRTTNGGASWAPSPTPPEVTWWSYLGFTNSTYGFGLGRVGSSLSSPVRLYSTTDGGRIYRPVPIG